MEAVWLHLAASINWHCCKRAGGMSASLRSQQGHGRRPACLEQDSAEETERAGGACVVLPTVSPFTGVDLCVVRLWRADAVSNLPETRGVETFVAKETSRGSHFQEGRSV